MNDIWQLNSPLEPMSWAQTLDYVKKNEGYRLPNIDELQTAFQEKITGFKESLYWTSEEHTESNSIFFVDFYKGVSSFCGKDSRLLVRLIKK